MLSELKEVEMILSDLMRTIQSHSDENTTPDASDLQQWYKELGEASFLVKDILTDEMDSLDTCD